MPAIAIEQTKKHSQARDCSVANQAALPDAPAYKELELAVLAWFDHGHGPFIQENQA